MNVSADSLSDTSRESDDAATDAARSINWTNTRAPRNQPKISKPGTPGPVATSRSRSLGFKPLMLAGGFKRRMLNKRETTAVASANAAMAMKEPRSCQIADINNSAIQTILDAANHAVIGWVRMTLKPHPIMMIATTKVTRLSQRAELSIPIASAPRIEVPPACRASVARRALRCRSQVDLGDAHLLQQREIVLDVPIVGDPAVLDLDEISSDEGDRLTFALPLAKLASEVTGEAHMQGDVVAGDDHLLHRNLEVRHSGAEPARSEGRSLRSLRSARRQRVIDEVGRDGFLQQGLVAGVPEIVECADCLHRRIALRVCHCRSDDEVIDLDALSGKDRRGQRKRQCDEGLYDAGTVQFIRHRQASFFSPSARAGRLHSADRDRQSACRRGWPARN